MKKAQQDQSSRLIRDEQRVLDTLIRQMDRLMLDKNRQLTQEKLDWMKAKSSGLPEAYGDLVTANLNYKENREDRRRMGQSRDELYSSRMILRQKDDEQDVDRDIDVKVGLHNYNYGAGDPLILGWFMPLCRHFILDEASKSFDVTVDGVHTQYTLEMKRKVDIVFDKVRKVTELYSIYGDEEEKVIADEFLQELLSRRNETEFRNIVFSIQKKQGEIIAAPFSRNMIIQGCAGSGKSMIMLHRLPIVLFDNQKTLSRSSLYVITPSETYIQMARNMMADLEISDIPMGTMEDYFVRVLGRYGIDPHDEKDPNYYGKIKSYIPLSEEQVRYVYSEDCIADIRSNMQELIDAGMKQEFASEKLRSVLDSDDVKKAVDFNGKLRGISLGLSEFSSRDWSDSRKSIKRIRQILKTMNDVQKRLQDRKDDLQRTISYLMNQGTKELHGKIKKARSAEMKLPENAEERKRLLDDIDAQKIRIQWDEEALGKLDTSTDYFDGLTDIAYQLADSMREFECLQHSISSIERTRVLQLIGDREKLSASCLSAAEKLDQISDPFEHYSISIHSIAKRLRDTVSDMEQTSEHLLSEEDSRRLKEAYEYYRKVSKSIARTAYRRVMKKLGQEPDSQGNLTAISCSPYLYTQIMYQFRGVPNGAKESLITIDEAQTMTPAEMKLIQNVNGNRLVLNLFGDVHQHIEGTKGVDQWEDLNRDHRFEIRTLDENYRNAREITLYCNKTFGLNMQAINTSGNGVHVIDTFEQMQQTFAAIFSRPLGNGSGYNCIIVKNHEEAASLCHYEKAYNSRINDMTDQLVDLDIRKWNLMTGSQAKGLEFSTVFALSGRMSPNEKYITYTRAMNELYVYSKVLPLAETQSTSVSDVYMNQRPVLQLKENGNEEEIRKKRTASVLHVSQGLKEFLMSEGLKIADDRSRGGYLWVIGAKETIRPQINQAIEKFSISGKYGVYKDNGKIQDGWYTKSKK